MLADVLDGGKDGYHGICRLMSSWRGVARWLSCYLHQEPREIRVELKAKARKSYRQPLGRNRDNVGFPQDSSLGITRKICPTKGVSSAVYV